MTAEEFEKLFESKCKNCQKLMHESWCIEFGTSGLNPYCALIQCKNKEFKPFKQKVEGD